MGASYQPHTLVYWRSQQCIVSSEWAAVTPPNLQMKLSANKLSASKPSRGPCPRAHRSDYICSETTKIGWAYYSLHAKSNSNWITTSGLDTKRDHWVRYSRAQPCHQSLCTQSIMHALTCGIRHAPSLHIKYWFGIYTLLTSKLAILLEFSCLSCLTSTYQQLSTHLGRPARCHVCDMNPGNILLAMVLRPLHTAMAGKWTGNGHVRPVNLPRDP